MTCGLTSRVRAKEDEIEFNVPADALPLTPAEVLEAENEARIAGLGPTPSG